MGDLRTRMGPRQAVAELTEFVNDSMHVPTSVRNAIEDLTAFVDDMLHEAPIDALALKRLIDNAEWEWREDWQSFFAYHGVSGVVADVLDWSCSSCRDDVGWADWTSARKDKDGVITLHVECGHCGADYVYDAEGNQLDD